MAKEEASAGNDGKSSLLDSCRWPSLAAPYDRALRALVSYILERFHVLGIVISGSIVRGNPNAGSDFDTFVIHACQERQRVQKFFHGVPAEIFLNPPAAVRSYFRHERKSGRPCTAHMLATGFVVLDRDPLVQTLVDEANAELQKRPDLSTQELLFKRYGAADRYENAVDIAESDPANARLMLYRAIQKIIEYRFLAQNLWLPRHKELLGEFVEANPDLGQLALDFYNTTDCALQFQIAEQLARRILGATGFFEWETVPEVFKDD